MNFIELSDQKEVALIERVNDVYIKKGEILSGTITANHVGKGKAGAVIHII